MLLSAAPIGSELQVNTTTASCQFTNNTGQSGSVAMGANGDVAVAWTSYGQDDDENGVYAQRYAELTDTPGPIVADVLDGERPIIEGAQLVSSVPALTVAFSDDLDVTGGSSGAHSVTNPANWLLTRNGVDVTGTISGISFGFNAATNKFEAVLSFSTPLADGQFHVSLSR